MDSSPLSGVERQLVEAALAFANSEARSVAQVEAIFRRVPVARTHWQTLKGSETVAAFRRDRDELIGWLSAIAAGKVTGTMEQAINDRLAQTLQVGCQLRLERGRLSPQLTYYPNGVQASYGLAVALLLSGPERLRVCKKCGVFFYDAGKKGKRRDYCSDAHANADRQKRYRDN